MKKKPAKEQPSSSNGNPQAASVSPRSNKSGSASRSNSSKASRQPLGLLALLALGLAIVAAVLAWFMDRPVDSSEKYQPRPPGQLTFNKDIAPIIFQHCSQCHRPGQSAPFSLLTYQDVTKRAKDVAEVTARRYMPPWLPEHGYGQLAGERRLTAQELGLLQQWLAEGAKEGAAPDLPPLPQWSGDWQLGTPDLVVTMPQYQLGAEGRDLYRNFVAPVPIQKGHFVKGIEFHPGNPRIVHHAFVKVDRTGQSRALAEGNSEPGFPGLSPPAEAPDCHFLGWQPGRVPEMGPPGLPWRLDPGNDLVLQMHLNRTGKPELLQSSIGLYFTDQAPTNTCKKIVLTSLAIDIPAGETNYVVEDSYTLPVAVDVLSVLPHAHYLAKEMAGWATLPNGGREWLVLIKQWDFNWQGAYRYVKPVTLPQGSKISMRFTYDNSTNNARNPNQPPLPVTYGQQSKDEMGELWFQFLVHRQEDLARLTTDYEKKTARVLFEADQFALRKDPNDAGAHTDLGMMFMSEGKPQEAEAHYQTALRAHPEFALAHYDYGLLLRRLGRVAEAQVQFQEDVRLEPKDYKAHGNLGAIALEQGNLEAARAEFEAALRINPQDALAKQGLAQALGTPGTHTR